MKRFIYILLTTPLFMIWIITYPVAVLTFILADLIEEKLCSTKN